MISQSTINSSIGTDACDPPLQSPSLSSKDDTLTQSSTEVAATLTKQGSSESEFVEASPLSEPAKERITLWRTRRATVKFADQRDESSPTLSPALKKGSTSKSVTFQNSVSIAETTQVEPTNQTADESSIILAPGKWRRSLAAWKRKSQVLRQDTSVGLTQSRVPGIRKSIFSSRRPTEAAIIEVSEDEEDQPSGKLNIFVFYDKYQFCSALYSHFFIKLDVQRFFRPLKSTFFFECVPIYTKLISPVHKITV